VRLVAPSADHGQPNALLSNAAARLPEPDQFFYPAMSVPLGPDDELNCPAGHPISLVTGSTRATGLEVLTIGYSGLDTGLLNLVRFSCHHSGESALEAAGRIAQPLQRAAATPDMASQLEFHWFVAGDELTHLAQL
jgi:hypothetical protein